MADSRKGFSITNDLLPVHFPGFCWSYRQTKLPLLQPVWRDSSNPAEQIDLLKVFLELQSYSHSSEVVALLP